MAKSDKDKLELIDIKKRPDILMNPSSEKLQSMQGFDPQYSDIVDYIVRITHKIWEEADMGYIYETYLHNLAVHTAYGTSYGVEGVVSGSVAFLAALPDRRMYPEDVIWAGDDKTEFHSSHLIVNTGTNTGYSPWGPPSGKKANFLAIAHCVVKENRVIEEWLVRDTGAMVSQLGFDIWDIAKQARTEQAAEPFGETDRLKGQLPLSKYIPEHKDWHVEDFVKGIFHDVFNGRHFNVITETHSSDIMMFVPQNRQLIGATQVRTYLLNFIAMFPDAHMNIEHVHFVGNETEGYRVAVRWRFQGTHQIYGFYGKPSGKRLNLLGISQVHVKDQKVTRHYMVFDELAVAMQLV